MTVIDRRHILAMVGGSCSLLRSAPCFSADAPLVELPGHVEAPDYALADLAGVVHRLSDLRGRPALVSFWAVWCAPCRRELPALASLRARLSSANIEVLAVNLGDGVDRIRSFLADHPSPDLPILLGSDTTAAAWHVQELPVAYAMDRTGILRLGAVGDRDWNSAIIEGQLRALP